jgi:mannose-6-phosphate isomerase-like protein (cupin superfamily)
MPVEATGTGPFVHDRRRGGGTRANTISASTQSDDPVGQNPMAPHAVARHDWLNPARSTASCSDHVVIRSDQTPQPAKQRKLIMNGYVQDIESLAIKNEEFRRVLYTAKYCQLVLMALKPKEEIGAEVHKLDQFFRVEEGSGEAVLDGVRTAIRAGFAVVVPAGTNHNIINTGDAPMKLYTIYSPPNHRDGVVHHTRAEADADHEHFDGKTTQ